MADFQNPETFRAVLDNLPTAVCLVDQNGTIRFWNQGAQRLTGYLAHEVIGHNRRDNILPHCGERGCAACGDTCPFHQARIDGQPRELQISLHHKDGHYIRTLFRITPVRDQRGPVLCFAESFEVPAKYRQDRDQRSLIPPGCVDEVTGTANHGFTEFHLRENLAGFSEYHMSFGILWVRAERFDALRAAYGVQAGEAVLKIVAETLCDGVRPSDFVGRWGEDQFIAILMNCGAIGAERAAQRIRKTMAEASLIWWGETLSFTTSMAYAAVEAGDTVESLVQRAQNSLSPTAAHVAAAGSAAGPNRSRS